MVQALKNHKDALLMGRRNADAVVLDREHPLAVGLFCPDPDNRRINAAKLESIDEEILEELDKLDFIAQHRGQGSGTNLGAALFNGREQVGPGLSENGLAVRRCQGFAVVPTRE